MTTTTSRLFQYSKCDPMLMTKILLLTRVILKSFQKKKEDSSLCHTLLLVMLCYTLPSFSWHNLHQRQEFWVLQLIPHVLGTKIEIHYSLLLFTRYYSWHCLLWIFAYLRGVVPYIWSKFLVCLVLDFFPRESYPLWAFLWEISLLTTTSLHLYYLYKACN